MDFPPLRSVVALARHRHMGRAAAELHVSTPTVSKHLRHLERAVERELFSRSHLGMVPTSAGNQLLDVVIHCLTAYDAVLATMQQLRSRTAGWLDLGVDGDLAAWRIPQVLQALRIRHPDLAIRLHPCPSQQILEEVHLGRFRAGWVLGVDATPDLAAVRLPDLTVRICGPVGRKAWLATASLADLVDGPWIDHDPGGAMSRLTHMLFPERQRRPQVICQMGGSHALEEVARQLSAFCLVCEDVALAGERQGTWAVWPGRLPPVSRQVVTRLGQHDDPLDAALAATVADTWRRHHEVDPGADSR
jgi:DNA-binding transcriptional LysR family regulator